jgi:transposase
MAFSLDLRERVISSVDNNMHVDEAAKVFKVSRRVIYEWLELRKATGSLVARSGYQTGRSPKITDWVQFKEFVAKHRHCASPQMRVEWKKLTNIDISETTMLRALKKINYTYKKNIFLQRS